MKKNFERKIESQPLNFPSAGCIFKNPGKISAGKLIEKCNLKGKEIGGAKISEKHGNFILNFKNAKAKDVIKLIELMKQKVKKKFGIVLKEEICRLGF
jgi:UDP-N-acetylmuramate dehydrogenase